MQKTKTPKQKKNDHLDSPRMKKTRTETSLNQGNISPEVASSEATISNTYPYTVINDMEKVDSKSYLEDLKTKLGKIDKENVFQESALDVEEILKKYNFNPSDQFISRVIHSLFSGKIVVDDFFFKFYDGENVEQLKSYANATGASHIHIFDIERFYLHSSVFWNFHNFVKTLAVRKTTSDRVLIEAQNYKLKESKKFLQKNLYNFVPSDEIFLGFCVGEKDGEKRGFISFRKKVYKNNFEEKEIFHKKITMAFKKLFREKLFSILESEGILFKLEGKGGISIGVADVSRVSAIIETIFNQYIVNHVGILFSL